MVLSEKFGWYMKNMFKTKSNTENIYDILFISMFKLSIMICVVGALLGAIFVHPFVLMLAMFLLPFVLIGLFFSLKIVKIITRSFKFTNHFKFRIMVGLSYAILADIYVILYLFSIDKEIVQEWGVLFLIFVLCTIIGFISAKVLPNE